MDLPWCCVGDFNEIVKAEEKMGGADRRERQMVAFRAALDFCGFRDLGFVGSPFTWCNNQFDGVVTWIRLDRGVATPSWSAMFPSVRVHHISGSLSDHCPLWLCSDDESVRYYKQGRPFRFEAMWMKDDRCEGVVRNAWERQPEGNPMEVVANKIENCSTQLKTWSRLSFGNIKRLLQQKKKLLVQAEALSMARHNHDQVRILKSEVYDLMIKEDCMWQQRSRVDWLKAGDLNTSYFHSRANQRNRRNFISSLTLEGGTILTEENQIGDAMVDYFQKLFTSEAPSSFEPILQGIECKVTEEMNVELTRAYTAKEVEQAIKQMKSMTALGPDGMPPLFYKSFWTIVGQDVTNACLSALNSSSLPSNINHTFITLIPKMKSPTSAKDFRPISFCNVLYKIISKTIANRLKNSLPKLVSESQSAFMSNRLISDNILIAFETLHHLKNKRTGRSGYMALKLDMSKAYDRVEWAFLEKLMAKLGFDQKLIKLISTCIRSVSFSVMINGVPHGMFHPQRGLRQGDPLLPYLFILCAEGLHSLM